MIYNTFSVIVAQRQRELAVLSAIGATPKQIKRALRFEGLVIGVFGLDSRRDRRLLPDLRAHRRPRRVRGEPAGQRHQGGTRAGHRLHHRRHPDHPLLGDDPGSAGGEDRTDRGPARGRGRDLRGLPQAHHHGDRPPRARPPRDAGRLRPVPHRARRAALRRRSHRRRPDDRGRSGRKLLRPVPVPPRAGGTPRHRQLRPQPPSHRDHRERAAHRRVPRDLRDRRRHQPQGLRGRRAAEAGERRLPHLQRRRQHRSRVGHPARGHRRRREGHPLPPRVGHAQRRAVVALDRRRRGPGPGRRHLRRERVARRSRRRHHRRVVQRSLRRRRSAPPSP